MADNISAAFAANVAQNYGLPGDTRMTSVSVVGGSVTNLSNIAGTWGKFIPVSWGNVRLAGYQVWASKFYKITDSITVSLTENASKLTEYWKDVTGTTNGMLYGDRTHTGISERIGVDAAFSFGYNGLAAERRVSKLRVNGNVIYDITNPDAKSDFPHTIRYGSEDYPEPIMVARATNPEDVVYYPGQIIITFAGLVNSNILGESNTSSPIPTSIDIELQSGSTVGQVEGIRTNFPDADFEIPFQGSIHNSWEGDFIYTYDPSASNNGSIKKWKLSTLALEKTVPITVFPNNASQTNDKFIDRMHMARGMKLLVAQFRSPGNYGAIYLINPETGQQVYKYGQDGWETFSPFGSGFPYSEYINIAEDTADAITVIGANSNNTLNVLRIVKNGNSFSASQSSFSRQGLSAIPNAYNRGDNGVSLYRWGTKLYKVTAQGMTLFYEDPRFGPTIKDFTTVDDKVFIAFSNDIVLLDKDANIIYDITMNDNPKSPGDAYGWSNTAESNRQLQLRKPGSPNYVGSWLNDYTYNINMLTGETTWTKVVGALNVNIPAGGTFYDPDTGKFYQTDTNGSGNGYVQLAYTSFGERILLRDFLRSLFVNTGKYTADQITFDGIDDTIVGALLVKDYTLDAIVNNTCRLYQIEKLETRNTIKFYRNSAIVGDSDIQYDLDLDNLALVSEGNDENISLITTISDSQQTIAQINLTFIDWQAEYNENTVSYRRPDAPADATTVENISTIIVMDKTEAMQLVQALLQDRVSAQSKHQLRLPPSLSDVYKGDIIRVTHKGYVSVMKVTETTVNADHSVSCLADGAILARRALPAIPDVPIFNSGAALGEGDTVLVPLDINPLHPAHNFTEDFPYYYLAYGDLPKWAGGYVVRSNSKEPEGRLFESPSSIGFAAYKVTNALGNKPWEVDFDGMQLEKVGGNWNVADNTTIAELCKSKSRNLAIYGAPGRYEIMQVASVVNGVATGVFRGLQGTDVFCGLHQPGDMLYLLKDYIVMERRPLDNVGITDNVKGVSYWQKFADVNYTSIEVEGNALKPFAPVSIKGVVNGADIDVTWSRRDRAMVNSFKPMPMSEATEKYEVDIIKNGAVIRTIENIPQASFVYTSAMRTEDGTDADNSLTVDVFQISAVVGRGYAGRASFNVG